MCSRVTVRSWSIRVLASRWPPFATKQGVAAPSLRPSVSSVKLSQTTARHPDLHALQIRQPFSRKTGGIVGPHQPACIEIVPEGFPPYPGPGLIEQDQVEPKGSCNIIGLLQVCGEAELGPQRHGIGQPGVLGHLMCQESKRRGLPPEQESPPGERPLLQSSIPKPLIPCVKSDKRIRALNPGAIG